MKKIITLILITFQLVSSVAQSLFTPNRLVVVQTVGSVSKGGSPVTLKEYSTNGVAGTTVAIPATGTTPFQITAGPGGSEGFLTKSTDGTFLVLAGYSTSTTNITDITATTAASTPRVIFKIDQAGNYTQVGASTTYYNSNDIRGAISDGTNYWASGASNATDGINYYGPNTPTALALGAKAYGLQIFNGQIYYSTQKPGPSNLGIFALGNGMPTGGIVAPLQIINTGTATPQDFSFNPTGDVCYIAISLNSAVGGIQKWIKMGNAWSLAYTLGTGVPNIGAYGLVVDYSGITPILYATTFESHTIGNRIIRITDTGVTSIATTLVTAPANTWFHGIAFTPSCTVATQPAAFTASSNMVDLGQSNVVYTVPNDPTVTYSWSYSGTGGTINGTGNSITMNFSSTATHGTLLVNATNSCGMSGARTIDIEIKGAIRITEYMYNGKGKDNIGEFVEFTNVGGTPVDMTGWSFDDKTRMPGSQILSAFGTVQPGQSVIFTDNTATAFRTDWNLCVPIKIIGGNTNNLARADEINLYDAANQLVDRLTYDDQIFTGSIRTNKISGWVTPAGLGTNTPINWVLSAANDSEGSTVSSAGDIGSPGKSKRATVSFNPCAIINTPPTIIMDVVSTSNYLDGGVLTSPASPYSVSGAISDPTDPASTLGIFFTVNDAETIANSLTLTATSSNTTVVPLANIIITGTGTTRNVKISPVSVGYADIIVTVNDGNKTAFYTIAYATSAASTTPLNTLWHNGSSDASNAVAIDDNYYITGDDELNVLNVYSRSASGLAVQSYDYTANLALPDPSNPETDLEAATSSGVNANRIYWLGSMSNGKAPFDNKPNRDRIFATTVTGTGASTSFSFVGYYGSLRANVLTWGDANGYDFTASAAAGVDSKLPNGFAAEGMVFAPDNTTLYIGLRAPLVPTATRTKAVIAPIANFETWFNNGTPLGTPVFESPIELDLGGRGIRDLIKLSNGTYIIIAGNPAGNPLTSALYKWTGNAADSPVMITTPADGILNIEGAMQINDGGQLALNKLQVISDGGDQILYNDGIEAKDFTDINLRKFRSDNLNSIDLGFREITVQGNNTTIIDGDTIPSIANNTDFGSTTIGAIKTKTFVIENSGSASLVVSNINFIGVNANEFSVINPPTFPLSIAANNSQTITIQFSPLSCGLHKTMINITNNDFDESIYNFLLQAMVLCDSPKVNITAPANGSSFVTGSLITITANAYDANNAIASVQFFVNSIAVGIDSIAPYSFDWAAVVTGNSILTAKATNTIGISAMSTPVTISIVNPNTLPYSVITSSGSCSQSNFCLAIAAIDSVKNIIGYDMVVHYDKNKVRPTGIITVNNSLINPNYVDVASNNDSTMGNINISVFINSSAPANTEFRGKGNLLCVEFSKTANFQSIDTVNFSVPTLQESYYTGIVSQVAESGKYITYKDSTFYGQLKFWTDNSPIVYNIANPNQYLITNIVGTDLNCSNKSIVAVQPDLSGNFSYNIVNGKSISIERDILAITSVMSVINGADALLAKRVLVNDPNFIPSIYQMIAMDVNTDGIISAGDVSQINQRTVLNYVEYKQLWNYNSNGNSNGQLSKDWLFIDTVLLASPAYKKSATYPLNDGVGYSKTKVPLVPFCLELPISDFSNCPLIKNSIYKGILLGDVDGNYDAIAADGSIKKVAVDTTDKIIFDFSKAVNTPNYIDIPVSINSDEDIDALDIEMKFNLSKLKFESVINNTTYIDPTYHFNNKDETLRFTSNSLTKKYAKQQPLLLVRFAKLSKSVCTASDIYSVIPYLNGKPSVYEIVDTISTSINDVDPNSLVTIYPNPSSGVINIKVAENATIQLLDIEGRDVILQTNVFKNHEQEIDLQHIADGIYTIKIYNNQFIVVKKVVLNKK